MIKLLLASTVIFMSFSSVAAEEIDLTQDAMYYCIDTLSTGIHKGKAQGIELEKHTLKVKDGLVTFSGYVEINSNEARYNRMLTPKNIKFATIKGTFMAKSTDKGVFYTVVIFTYSEDDTINTYAAQGTCTKW